jgi:nitrite reductase/ring-hydroxylating ferredoxin subunit
MSVKLPEVDHMTMPEGSHQRFITVAQLDQLAPGALMCVDMDGTPITLANVEGTIYAFAAYCSHQQALLEEGELEGTEILCPWHGGSFDIRTGRVTSPPAIEDIETYRVQIQGDEIQVAKDAPTW